MLTVLTATYNRCDNLKKLYSSLLSQNEYGFEWVIADDGSEDNTADIVNSFTGNGKFPVKYISLPHGGKHRSINSGVKSSSGDFIIIMDSDDYFMPDSIKKIAFRTNQVKSIENIAGVMMSQYAVTNGKKTVNGDFPKDKEYVDLFNYSRNNSKYRGDRLEIIKRDMMLKYPFPEFEGEFFVTESAVWNTMSADGYKFRICGEPACIIEYLHGGLTQNYTKLRLNNYNGYVYAIKALCRASSVWRSFWVVRNYAIISKKKGISSKEAAAAIGVKQCVIKLMRII